jgi:tetratricopeptide (TPR) repeat protein
MTGRAWGAAIVGIAVVAIAARADAQSPEAVRLYEEGQAAYDARDYPAAIAAWRASYDLSKLPALIFNLAQAYRLNGDCALAVASYRRFVALAPEAPERGDAEGFIAELSPTCPPRIAPARLDDPARRVPRPTGDRLDAPGTRPSGHPGRGKRIAAVVTGIGGLALVGAGLYLGDRARGLAEEVSGDCADGCVWDDIRDKDARGRAAERDQYLFHGAGVAALGTAAVLYWLGARDARLTVTPRGDGAAMGWSIRYSTRW